MELRLLFYCIGNCVLYNKNAPQDCIVVNRGKLSCNRNKDVVKSRKMKEQEVFRHENRKCMEKIYRYYRGISV